MIEWVWTAENPYPETLDTCVYVRFRDGGVTEQPLDMSVQFWHGKGGKDSNWYQAGKSPHDIVAYEVVK